METSTRIFLIGFMGSGKTTLGKRLALNLKKSFFDLDEEVEKEAGLSISEIFEQQGEDYFRVLESKVLQKIIQCNDSFVMSLGGGTPCFNNNINRINQSGVSIYLKYSTGILSSRLFKAKTKRPLIKGLNISELTLFVERKLKERENYYNKSNFILEGSNLKVADLIQLLQ